MKFQESSLRIQMLGCELLHESRWPKRILVASGIGTVAIIGAGMYVNAKSGLSPFDMNSLFCGIGDNEPLGVTGALPGTVHDRAARVGEVSGFVGTLAGFAPAAHCMVAPLMEAPAVVAVSGGLHAEELVLAEDNGETLGLEA